MCVKRRICCALVLGVVLLGGASILLSCDSNAPRSISETRTVERAGSSAAGAVTSAQRFGFSPAGSEGFASTPGSSLSWQTPPGWRDMGATGLRLANFRIGPAGEAECYVTILGGPAGGVALNVNRWRSQMGLDEADPVSIAQLPKIPLLGAEAVFVDLKRSFGGMRDDVHAPVSEKRDGYALLGAILQREDDAVFLKMTGPEQILQQERGNFIAFSASLRDGGSTPVMASSGGAASGALQWEAPVSWKRLPDKPMRVASFGVPDAESGECYITLLPGVAGGLAANINRWRAEMGHAALAEEEIGNLPTIDIMGRPAPMVAIEGAFTGMDGITHPEWMLLGVVVSIPEQTLFVKMTGPRATVLREKENFTAFSRSIHIPTAWPSSPE